MKEIKETLLERRSIRRYECESISDDDLNFIYKAIQNTPTSYNGQQFSVIDISDQTLKEELYAITNQKQIKTCNHFLIFCADYNKIFRLADHKGINKPDFCNTMDGILVGIVDAALAMQNALVASNALGLGSCCIGYVRTADPFKVAEILNLPKGVFVVCGLAIGVPRELPDLKPKQSLSTLIFKNSYSNNEQLLTDLIEYDNDISRYNQTRSGSKSDNDWCGHILDYYKEALSYRILDYLKQQGFAPLK